MLVCRVSYSGDASSVTAAGSPTLSNGPLPLLIDSAPSEVRRVFYILFLGKLSLDTSARTHPSDIHPSARDIAHQPRYTPHGSHREHADTFPWNRSYRRQWSLQPSAGGGGVESPTRSGRGRRARATGARRARTDASRRLPVSAYGAPRVPIRAGLIVSAMAKRKSPGQQRPSPHRRPRRSRKTVLRFPPRGHTAAWTTTARQQPACPPRPSCGLAFSPGYETPSAWTLNPDQMSKT